MNMMTGPYRFDGVESGRLELLQVGGVDPVLLQDVDGLVRDSNLEGDEGTSGEREAEIRDRQETDTGCTSDWSTPRRAAAVLALTSMTSSPTACPFWSCPSMAAYSCCSCTVVIMMLVLMAVTTQLLFVVRLRTELEKKK
jgi:hypothetical protein